jgi:hypothetical protein
MAAGRILVVMLDEALSVLVLYENFAVGAALQRRLLDVPMVHLVRAENLGLVREDDDYDVIVVCPYLREQRRAEVLARWGSNGSTTPIIELRDVGGATVVAVLAGAEHSAPAQSVLSALGSAL